MNIYRYFRIIFQTFELRLYKSNKTKRKNIKLMIKNIQDYVLLEKVGEGQYGDVYKAENSKNKGLFAIKVMALEKFRSIPKLTQLTNNEMKILSKINHPNIIKFVEILQTKTHYYLVYEYCNGGTLQDKIKMQIMINEHDAVSYFSQLISAFSALYEKKILHRDIKPTNILFHDGKLKLADFGFCKQLENSVMTKTVVGSPIYMAPQILRGEFYDSRADIWSLGVVLYEMLYGHCPYEDNSIPKLISMISNTMLNIPKFPRVCEPLKVFIKRMLTIKAEQRITPEEFIKYPIELALSQKDENVLIKIDYKQVIKFTRNNLLYVCQTLAKLAPIVNELQILRMAFLTYKIFLNLCRSTKQGGAYWEQIQFANKEYKWDDYYQEEMQTLRPYGQIVKDALKRCDNSLKIKLQFEKENIDTRFFLQNLKELAGQKSQIRDRLINCLLINIHYMRVLDKKKPDWRDFTASQKTYQEKEEFCYKYARYN